jgi:hypothetical protein
MNFVSKSFVAFALIAVLLLSFGCTQTQSDKSAFDSFSTLKESYSAVDSLPTNNIKLNDYISDLAALSSKSGGSAARIIIAELYSAQTFYYLNTALSASTGLDMDNMSCSSKDIKSAIISINLASDYYSKAVTALGGLSDSEKSYLRPNQLDSVKGYGASISQIKAFFDKKC